ncbi:MAG: histidine phosphatase family protein [Patescibacteria group bacterium]|jgi:probable phosphoglycerate mutase
MINLVFVRHGHTGYNDQKIVQGHSHNPLSEIGAEQARKVGERLKDQHFDIAFCSDLKRTKDTIKEILKYHSDLPVIYEPLLREKGSGIFEGKLSVLREEARLSSGLSKEDFCPEGGENDTDVLIRVKKFIKMIANDYSDKTILAVTHGIWLKNLFCYIDQEIGSKLTEIANTSISVVLIDENKKISIKTINDIKHLEETPSNVLTD